MPVSLRSYRSAAGLAGAVFRERNGGERGRLCPFHDVKASCAGKVSLKLCCARSEAYGVLAVLSTFTAGRCGSSPRARNFAARLPKLFLLRSFGVAFRPPAGAGEEGRKFVSDHRTDKLHTSVDLWAMRPGRIWSPHQFCHVGRGLLRDAFLRGLLGRAGSHRPMKTLPLRADHQPPSGQRELRPAAGDGMSQSRWSVAATK